MSVLAVFRWKGDPDALLAAYDRELQHAVPLEQPRRVTHICARSDNEVVIVDLWETEEDLQRMMENPDFFEGVRSIVVDKDRNPKWTKRDITKVTAKEVEAFFKPLDKDQELILYPSATAAKEKKE